MRALRSLSPFLVVLGLACGRPAAEPETLVVFNAGSLARPLRAALDTFAVREGVVVAQESAGSLETARKLTELGKIPDVLALADAEVFPRYLMPAFVEGYAEFARNRMVLAYTDRSRFAAEVGPDTWWQILLRPGVETGRSVFTVLAADTAVPPALSLAASPWERLGNWRAPIALVLVLAGAVVVAGIDFLKSTGEAQWDELALAGLTVAGLSMSWAAFWSALAAISRRHADFWAHLALASATSAFWFGGMEATTYLSYALASDAPAVIFVTGWVLGALLMYLLLWNALELATPLRHPALAAFAATAAVYALMGLQELAERDEFTAQPQPVTVLRAPFAKLRAGLDYDSFDAGVAELFAALPEED